MQNKMSFFLLLLALVVQNGFAQDASTEDLWFTQIEEAKAQAQANNQPIVMIFSGSDWCRPCMAMKNRVLDNKVFTDFAKENVVLLEVDFPRRSQNKLSPEQTKHNNDLAEKYGPKVFPTLVIVDSSGQEIDRMGYQSSLAAVDYVKYIKFKITQ